MNYVKHTNASNNLNFDSDWLILGHFDSPVSSSIHSAMNLWLMQTLGPLNLQTDVLEKICKSTLATTIRAIPDETGTMCHDLHLVVFVPIDFSRNGQNWGFFLVEKLEASGENNCDLCLEIELFLYREGH